MPTAFDVQQYVHGLKWPATRNEVLEHARDQGADEDMLALLEELPDTDFTSEIDISKSLGAYGPRSGSLDHS